MNTQVYVSTRKIILALDGDIPRLEGLFDVVNIIQFPTAQKKKLDDLIYALIASSQGY